MEKVSLHQRKYVISPRQTKCAVHYHYNTSGALQCPGILALTCPGRTHTFGRRSLGNIPRNYLNNAQVNEAFKSKYLAQGHKHVRTGGTRTHDLAFWGPILFR